MHWHCYPRAILVFTLLFVWSLPAQTQEPTPTPLAITNWRPDKARYTPGDTVALLADMHNPTAEPAVGCVQVQISHIDQQVHADSRRVTLAPGESRTETFVWHAPSPDFTGYLATLSRDDVLVVSTGIDVSSTAVRFPRYGYISEFTPGERETQQLDGIHTLAQEFHLNLFQFYDWFWRHEQLIRFEDGRVAESWRDIFARTHVWQVIRDLIAEAHRYNALALGYVMSYAAREGYAEQWPIDPGWGLFAEPNAQRQLNIHFSFGSEPTLFLFNPANSGWQDWIIGQYIEAVNLAGFDGVHIDQFGPRYEVLTADSTALDLPSAFRQFLQTVKARLLHNNARNAVCTFNLVDGEVEGWATREVATSNACDFLYSELWYEANTYDEVRRYIEYLRMLSGNLPVVLAGYANYNQDIGPIQEAESAAALVGVTQSAHTPGFTGTGFVEGFDAVGDAVSWFVTGPPDNQPALVTFAFRFANVGEVIATRNVYVDDVLIGEVRFSTRALESAWGTDAWIQTLLTPGLHMVRIAFDPGNVGVVALDHLRLGEFDEDSVRLENAVMFASGATHIQLGDNIQSLSHEYYPNRSKSLTVSLRTALRRYYDFITAYENLLFDRDVQMLGTATQQIAITTGQHVLDGGINGIYTLLRRWRAYDIVHLINFIGLDDHYWRNQAPTPIFQENIGLRYYAVDLDTIDAVYVASPDFAAGTARRIEFTRGSDERGTFIECTIPRLEYWDMLLLHRASS